MWKLSLESEVIELDALSAVDRAVWVPSEAISFMDCAIAPKQRRLLRQMVPFALEESLVDPIEELHFAFSSPHGDKVAVVVVSQQQMDEWQIALRDKGIEAQMLLPDIYALPFEEGKITLWHENDRCLLRTAPHSGMAGTLNWITALIKAEGYADDITIYSDNPQALPEEWQAQANALPESLDQRMQRFEVLSPINLLQGDYALRHPMFSLLKVWRPVALLALLAIVAHIGNIVYETQYIEQKIPIVQKKTKALYQTFGTSDSPLTTRAQVQQYIQKLTAYENAPQNAAWTILPRVDKVISKCRVCQVEKIELNGEVLTIELKAVGEFGQSKEALLDMKAIKTEYELLREEGGQTFSQFKFRLTT